MRRIVSALATLAVAAVSIAVLPVITAAPAAAALGADSSYSLEYAFASTGSATPETASYARVYGGDVPIYGGATTGGGFRLMGTVMGASGGYELRVTPPAGMRLDAGKTYETAMYPTAGKVVLSIATPGCNAALATLRVDAAGYDEAGVLTSIAGSYSAACGYGRLVGHIRWNDSTPYAAVTAPAQAFGLSALDAARTKTVTVTAVGTEALTLGSADLAGPTPAAFAIADDRCSSLTLAPGEACEIDVTFRPTLQQRYATVLSIPVPDRMQGPIQVALSGIGEILPAAPPAFRAFPGTDGVGVAWSAPTGSTLIGYRVYRSLDGGASDLLTTTTTAREWADTTVPPGSTATYSVSAVNELGEGPATAPASAAVLTEVPATGSVTALFRDLAGAGTSSSMHMSGSAVARTRTSLTTTRLYANGPTGSVSLEVGRVSGPGTYATRSDGAPGSLLLKGAGCYSYDATNAPGELVIREVAYDAAGLLLTLDASWRMDADCGLPESGEIRYASTAGYQAITTELVGGWNAGNAGSVRTGTAGTPRQMNVTNVGTEPMALGDTTVTEPAEHWTVSADTCGGTTLAPGGTCYLDTTFTPQTDGDWSSKVSLADGTAVGARVFAVNGTSGSAPGVVPPPTAYAAGGRAYVTPGAPSDWANGEQHSFNLYRGTTPDDLVQVNFSTADGRPDTFYEAGLTQGSRVYYAAAARNEYGTGPRSEPVAVDVPIDEVFFVRDSYGPPGGDLHSIPATGGTARKLQTELAYEPALSPDGMWLAYSKDVLFGSSWRSRVYVRRVDGTGLPRPVTGSTAWYFQPSWAPDGQSLVATRLLPTNAGANVDLVTTPLSGGLGIPIPGTSGLEDAAYSPDGRSLVAVDVGPNAVSPPKLVRINRDGTGRADVLGGSGGTSPAVSKDGRIVLVHRTAANAVTSTLRLLPWAGGVGVELPSAGFAFEEPSWSPDGSTIYAGRAALAHVALSNGWHVISLDPSTPGNAVDNAGDLGVGWSPVSRVLDTAPPVVQLTATPALQPASLHVPFTVTDNTTASGGLTVRCSLDGGAEASCATSYARTGVTAGAHELVVRATDLAGNTASSTYNFTVDGVAPSARMTAPTALATLGSTVTAKMTATDATGVTAYAFSYLAISPSGTGSWASPTSWQNLPTGAVTTNVQPGKQYCFRGRARDAAGNWSPYTAEMCTSVPLDERSLTASSGWTRSSTSSAWQASLLTTMGAGRQLKSGTIVARRVGVVVTRCSTCGTLDVLAGGKRLGGVNTKATTKQYRSVLWLPASTSLLKGSVVLRTISKAPVYVDGLVLAR